jgi:hypothetical protein
MQGAFVQVVVDFLKKMLLLPTKYFGFPLFDGSHGDESMLYVIESFKTFLVYFFLHCVL